MLEVIVADFCQVLDLHAPNWRDSRSSVTCCMQQLREYRMTEVREVLLGVVLLLFQPERIYQVLPGQVKSGVIKSLSEILNVQKPTLSVGANTAITHFKAYKEFNGDVLYVYQQLINKRNYFEHGEDQNEQVSLEQRAQEHSEFGGEGKCDALCDQPQNDHRDQPGADRGSEARHHSCSGRSAGSPQQLSFLP